MRTTTAYFAGAGTVVIAIAAALGGGLVVANMVSPHQPKGAEMSKMERRMSEPVPASNAAAEPTSYLAATQAAANNLITVSPAPKAPPQPSPPAQPSNATQASETQRPRDTNSSAPPTKNPQPMQTAAREPSPDDAQGMARDTNIKRDVRRTEERRKAKRRQQWPERRRHQPRRYDDLRDVERSVRGDSDPPRIIDED